MTARFDDEVERSWERFEQQLVADLHRRPEGDQWWVEPGDAGAGAWILAILPHDGVVSAELSGNDVLPDGHRLDGQQQRALAALGWEEPHTGIDEEPVWPGNWGCRVTREELPVLASMTVGALRQVLGVVHPGFLTGDLADGTLTEQDDEDGQEGAQSEDAESVVAFPGSVEEHRDVAAQVLRSRTGTLGPDDEGDFRLLDGSGVWVVVHPVEETPLVRVWGIAVRDLADTDQARREVNVLNRRLPVVKFYLEDDTVVAEAEVSAQPLVGGHLIDTVERVLHVLGRHADDLAERLDATTTRVPAPTEGPA